MAHYLKTKTSDKIYSAWINVLDLMQQNKNKGKNKENNRWIADLLRHETHALRDLWQIFTQERAALRKNLLNTPKAVSTYLLGFHLPNVMRIVAPWQFFMNSKELTQEFEKKSSILIYDLGCGTGAFSQAMLSQIDTTAFKGDIFVRLVDQNRLLLDAAEKIIPLSTEKNCKVFRHPQLLEDFTIPFSKIPEDQLVIVGLNYVWNELQRNVKARGKILAQLKQLLFQKKHVLLWLGEPANQDFAREAMELRDLLSDYGYNVSYPCPHSKACPMLERSRDWCFSEIQWQQSPIEKKIDEIMNLARSQMTCAGYIFTSSHFNLTKSFEETVVGCPVHIGQSHHHDQLLCTADGSLIKRCPKEKSESTSTTLEIRKT